MGNLLSMRKPEEEEEKPAEVYSYALRPEDHRGQGYFDFERVFYPKTKTLTMTTRGGGERTYEAKREDIIVDGKLVYRYKFSNDLVIDYTLVETDIEASMSTENELPSPTPLFFLRDLDELPKSI